MTVPRGFAGVSEKVSDFVRHLIPTWRNRVSHDELALSTHLRGNQALYDALCRIVNARLSGRAASPVSSNPMECLAVLSRDSELRWVLATLERAFHAPLPQPDDDGEQPA